MRMQKITLITGLCLILCLSSPVLASAGHSAVAGGQAESGRPSTHPPDAKADNQKGMVACPSPRPQVCTQDYRPVCAVLQDGSFNTYPNGCNACSDPAVSGYREGPCE